MHKAEPYATLICHSLIAIPAVAFDVALPFRYTAQSPAPGYTADCGYGFEAGDGNYFSVKVPEGNYNVTATVTWVTSMGCSVRKEMRTPLWGSLASCGRLAIGPTQRVPRAL